MLTVRVEDELTGSEIQPLVVEFQITLDIPHDPASMAISTITRTSRDPRGQGKSIRLTFDLECVDDFYGSDCGTFCAARDDALGHFTCDSSGDLICLDGFTDPSTNCTECVLSEGCCECICLYEFSHIYTSSSISTNKC